MPEDDIPRARVLATLLGGKTVHDTGVLAEGSNRHRAEAK
jgi:hypothetical protein